VLSYGAINNRVVSQYTPPFGLEATEKRIKRISISRFGYVFSRPENKNNKKASHLVFVLFLNLELN